MTRTREKAALLAGGLAVALLLAEIAVRFLVPVGDAAVRVVDPFFGRYDPTIGWRNREGAAGSFRPDERLPDSFIRINSRGLRGPEHSYEPAPGRTRVLVLGDSVTFGYGLDVEDSYPHLLQQALGDAHEVLNAAVIGYGTDQEYLWLREEGIRYRPDIVLVGFSAGDIFDSSCSVRFGTTKPFFRLEDGRLVLRNSPVPQRVPMRVLFGPNPARDALLEASHLMRVLYYRFSDPMHILRQSREVMDRSEAVNVVAELFRQMKRECLPLGCRVVAVVIPQENWLQATERDPADDRFRRGQQAALGVLNAAHVPFVDLWDAFYANLRKGLFLEGDFVHTSAEGNRLIAREIIRSGILD